MSWRRSTVGIAGYFIVGLTAGAGVATATLQTEICVDSATEQTTAIETFEAGRSKVERSFPSYDIPEVTNRVHSWAEPCEEMFEHYAEHVPDELLNMITTGELDPPRLTYAAEYAGQISGRDADVIAALRGVIAHEKAYVREGAVYGLGSVAHAEAQVILASVAADDPDEDVRRAAVEALAG